MASLLKAYNAALRRRPMLYQCATAGVLFASGDIIAQQLIEKRGLKHHDFARTARLGFYGGAMFGPILTKWLQFLDRLHFKTPLRAVLYKTYLDQGVFTPGVVAFFFGSMTLLEGKGLTDAADRISDNYVSTLIRNWGVFIPAQAINFTFVPPHLRFVFVGVVSLFWNTYLSSVNAVPHEHDHTHATIEEVVEPAAVSEAQKKDLL
ncbi:Protein required for ethanol metabolism [Steccherinum ochraceum]|uniref:Protein required for ethanol metabolism n=1 Tax=Steccherinum ochraceum TaxID=92696 RepID=A0A4R0RSE4_9APHY|nr:Protein required for ethanol metabolism [Steccherinum ochraceum]